MSIKHNINFVLVCFVSGVKWITTNVFIGYLSIKFNNSIIQIHKNNVYIYFYRKKLNYFLWGIFLD